MPLPFPTVERDDDLATANATATAAPSPQQNPVPDPYGDSYGDLYEDPRRRRRPYRPGPLRVGGAAVLLLLASYVLVAAVIIGVAGALPVAGVCLVVAVLLITTAWRSVRTGIWVDEHGLRQTGLLSATTLPWSAVGQVRIVQQPVRRLGVLGTVQGQALVVHRADGTPLRALVTDQGADFLGRPQAFAAAADATEEWVAELKR
ncbi:phage holin family protein [Streptomyces sp. NPDC053048]|uniref:phage holin family protein n=1 Tax=Streptomyces sp. NPDC053048 TaxID=3365694 RepID=UPI0037D629E3